MARGSKIILYPSTYHLIQESSLLFSLNFILNLDTDYPPTRKAKLLLKKKRFLEGLLEKTDTQMENLQQMVDNIEFTQIEVKVVEGLKQGNEALEQLHKVV